jgi:hypothetical protein
VVARLVLVLVLGCGGKKSAGEDAMRTPVVAVDAAGSGSGSAAPKGEAAIRVEWKGVPTSARQSPGRTACNTPRPPAVTPTTLWGIPDAIVLADKAPAAGDARITLADCAVTPQIAIASTLIVESTVDRPAKLTLTKHGTIASLGALKPGEVTPIQLPITGHAVALSLEAGGVYRLAVDGSDDGAWIVNAPGGVTDAAGLATLRLSPGPHEVTAWLPARGGQAWKVVKSTVTVEANGLAELAIDLGPR